MSKQEKPDGCAIFMRRTFLFLVGLIISKVLHKYFSVPGNFEKFLRLVQKLATQARYYLTGATPTVATSPSPPLPESSTPPLPHTPTPPPEMGPEVQLQTQAGKPLQFGKSTVNGVDVYQAIIDIDDPETFITIGLANNASRANSATFSSGDESFAAFVSRYSAAVIANGTFFSKDEEKRVMGNMVAGGEFLKYSRWENYGTTLGIKANNQLEMITARVEGQPPWQEHWFSLTCGPRLVNKGKIWLNPEAEGFKDPHVLDAGWRSALGFPREGNKLFLVNFLSILTLEEEAKLMQSLGCWEAMNLDGGASRALASKGKIVVPAGRDLTNVIVVYDHQHPAPESLINSWYRFQQGERPRIPT